MMPDKPDPKARKASRAWHSLQPALLPCILDAISSMGFKRMTPVQASTIPLALGNKDVVVEAVTGSGKTLAFLIPVIQKLLKGDEASKKHHVEAIILSPTRELAAQTLGVLKEILAFHVPSSLDLPQATDAAPKGADAGKNGSQPSRKIVSQLLVGGDVTPAEDLRAFLQNSPNLLIATPGRLLELLKSPHVHCPQSSFEILILDEADRLLDLGFKDDLQKIIAKLPKQRRTGLFSASVSEAVDQIIRVGLRNPVKISVKVKGASGKEDQRTPASLAMTYALLKPSLKLPAIAKILFDLKPTPIKTIVYLSTCAAVDYMQHLLPVALGLNASPSFITIPLHGKHPPSVRQKNFSQFSNAIVPTILLTTDVAARGLDIPQVDVVIQADPPSDPKVFLHRCGRAGRAGRQGLSIIMLSPGHEEDYITYLEVRKTPIKKFVEVDLGTLDEEGKCLSNKLRETVLHDKALHDKGQRAFVSWVQSYSKHQARSIFRLSDLDWGDLGDAWGLLKLPKMPELKSWDGDRNLGVNVDWQNYGYKDRQREAARVKALGENSTDKAVQYSHLSKKGSNSWSEQREMKESRERRREKRHAKRARERFENMSPEERTRDQELKHLISEVKRQKVSQDDLGEFEGFKD